MFHQVLLFQRILMTDTLKITDDVLPKFPKHVKFRYNKPRDEWVILAPERLVKLDDIAVERFSKLELDDKDLFIKTRLIGSVTKKTYIPDKRWVIDIKADNGSLIFVRSRYTGLSCIVC